MTVNATLTGCVSLALVEDRFTISTIHSCIPFLIPTTPYPPLPVLLLFVCMLLAGSIQCSFSLMLVLDGAMAPVYSTFCFLLGCAQLLRLWLKDGSKDVWVQCYKRRRSTIASFSVQPTESATQLVVCLLHYPTVPPCEASPPPPRPRPHEHPAK